MLELVNSALQTVAVNGNAQLGATKISTGCTVSGNVDSFRLNKPGFYLVAVTGSIGGLTNTAVNLSLVNNTTGVTEQGGSVVIAGLTAGGTQTIPFAIYTIVRLNGCGCMNNVKSMVLRNLSAAPITLTNLNTVVTKIA